MAKKLTFTLFILLAVVVIRPTATSTPSRGFSRRDELSVLPTWKGQWSVHVSTRQEPARGSRLGRLFPDPSSESSELDQKEQINESSSQQKSKSQSTQTDSPTNITNDETSSGWWGRPAKKGTVENAKNATEEIPKEKATKEEFSNRTKVLSPTTENNRQQHDKRDDPVKDVRSNWRSRIRRIATTVKEKASKATSGLSDKAKQAFKLEMQQTGKQSSTAKEDVSEPARGWFKSTAKKESQQRTMQEDPTLDKAEESKDTLKSSEEAESGAVKESENDRASKEHKNDGRPWWRSKGNSDRGPTKEESSKPWRLLRMGLVEESQKEQATREQTKEKVTKSKETAAPPEERPREKGPPGTEKPDEPLFENEPTQRDEEPKGGRFTKETKKVDESGKPDKETERTEKAFKLDMQQTGKQSSTAKEDVSEPARGWFKSTAKKESQQRTMQEDPTLDKAEESKDTLKSSEEAESGAAKESENDRVSKEHKNGRPWWRSKGNSDRGPTKEESSKPVRGLFRMGLVEETPKEQATGVKTKEKATKPKETAAPPEERPREKGPPGTEKPDEPLFENEPTQRDEEPKGGRFTEETKKVDESGKPDKTEEKSNVATKKRWWQRIDRKSAAKKDEKRESSEIVEKQKDKKKPTRPEVLPQNVTASERLTNQTKPSLATPTSSDGIIIATGLPPSGPYRYYRRGGPGPPQPPQPTSPNSVILVELVASVLGTFARLWFLTWLTRRLASQEELIQPTQHFVWERLNDRYQRDGVALHTALQAPPAGISFGKWRRKHVRKALGRIRTRPVDLSKVFTRTVVVVELSNNPKEGVSLEHLSQVVTFLLQQHRQRAFGVHKTGAPMVLEVVFLVDSPGGSVAHFGLAAAQMQRLSGIDGITTTVCVDKYAASGGYMIASQAHKLIAAQFATVGSIGVVLEGLNFNEMVQRYGVQPVVLKAGTSKNPLSTFGEISRKDIRHEEERLAKVHDVFRRFVVQGRPGLANSLSLVADGSVFLGQEALDLNMVDGVMTSEEYLLERIFAGDRVLKLHRSYLARSPLGRRSLSPLDILPHLKAWLQDKLEHPERFSDVLTQLVQVGSFLGLAQHVVQSYMNVQNNR